MTWKRFLHWWPIVWRITRPLDSPHTCPPMWSFDFCCCCCLPVKKLLNKQSIPVWVIWDAMAFTWRHCNDVVFQLPYASSDQLRVLHRRGGALQSPLGVHPHHLHLCVTCPQRALLAGQGHTGWPQDHAGTGQDLSCSVDHRRRYWDPGVYGA